MLMLIVERNNKVGTRRKRGLTEGSLLACDEFILLLLLLLLLLVQQKAFCFFFVASMRSVYFDQYTSDWDDAFI